jgi:hypothetical protein
MKDAKEDRMPFKNASDWCTPVHFFVAFKLESFKTDILSV